MAEDNVDEALGRILEARAASIDQFASDFHEAVRRDSATAPRGMQLDARAATWGFGPLRAAMDQEIVALAREYGDGASADFDLRVARVALAMYFLDKLAAMLDAATAARKPSLTSLFLSASSAALGIFDGAYFSKSNQRIINDYLDAEPVLVACAKACSVELDSLENAVKVYKMRVAEQMEAAWAQRA